MLNLNALFNASADDKASFIDNLDLKARAKAELQLARTEVRNCLREGIPAVLKSKGYEGDIPQPRFFTQGSWAYKTLNAPAQEPQQADLDDGVYLPMTFVKQTKKPSVATDIFFSAAEEALGPLVKAKGWILNTEKDTCIRIELSKYAHIDIPLYAIPDDQYVLLKAGMKKIAMDSLTESAVRAKADSWLTLPHDEVLLAHRKENWKKSDPRPLHDWFVNEVERHGLQLQRVVRYLKAYRDWLWPEGGPSSILIMATAVPLFKKNDGRDDIALLEVVKGMAKSLRAGVVSPADEDESLTARLGPEKVEEAAVAFEAFEKNLSGAIDSSSAEVACKWMIEKLGDRFPNEPTWVRVATVKETIDSVAPVAAASVLVGNNKSA